MSVVGADKKGEETIRAHRGDEAELERVLLFELHEFAEQALLALLLAWADEVLRPRPNGSPRLTSRVHSRSPWENVFESGIQGMTAGESRRAAGEEKSARHEGGHSSTAGLPRHLIMSKWGEEAEKLEEEGEGATPGGGDGEGLKTVVEERTNEAGQKVKITRQVRVYKTVRRVNKRAEERRKVRRSRPLFPPATRLTPPM